MLRTSSKDLASGIGPIDFTLNTITTCSGLLGVPTLSITTPLTKTFCQYLTSTYGTLAITSGFEVLAALGVEVGAALDVLRTLDCLGPDVVARMGADYSCESRSCVNERHGKRRHVDLKSAWTEIRGLWKEE